MPGRTEYEAVLAFAQPIQRALGCFTDGKITYDSVTSGRAGRLTINRNEFVPLPGDEQLRVKLAMGYVVVPCEDTGLGRWKVSLTGYAMRLDDAQAERVNFHWHPDQFASDYCHVHVRGHDQHIPTGRVFFEDLLALAVEVGAEPRNPDWDAVLEENRQNVARSQTWGHRPTT